MSQPVPQSNDRRTPVYRYSAVLAFGLAVFGAPIFELANGYYPGYGEGGPLSTTEVVEGGYARRIDRSLDDHSAIADTFGPRYRQILIELFRVGNQQIHFGHDDWLFLSASLDNYPPPGSIEYLPKLVGSIADTAREFEKHGCKVVFVLVPDKAVVAPEKVAMHIERPAEAFELALENMRREGLHVVDPRNVLREGDDVIHYFRTDTHWTAQGAMRTAHAVARQLLSIYPNGEFPGEPYQPVVETAILPDVASDLQGLLGVPEESAAWRRYLESRKYLQVRDPRTKEIVEDREPRAIVCGGTSFANGTNLPALLSASLGRRVENMTGAGKPISYPGVMLLEEIAAGTREWPRLFIWELPDRLFYLHAELPRTSLDQARALLTFDVHGGRPLEPAEIVGYGEDSRDATSTTFTRDATRSYFEYRFEPPLAADGELAFACAIAGKASTKCTVQFDTGEGFVENRSTVLLGADHAYHVVFPLKVEGGGVIHSIRFRPSSGFGKIRFEPPVLASRRR